MPQTTTFTNTKKKKEGQSSRTITTNHKPQIHEIINYIKKKLSKPQTKSTRNFRNHKQNQEQIFRKTQTFKQSYPSPINQGKLTVYGWPRPSFTENGHLCCANPL